MALILAQQVVHFCHLSLCILHTSSKALTCQGWRVNGNFNYFLSSSQTLSVSFLFFTYVNRNNLPLQHWRKNWGTQLPLPFLSWGSWKRGLMGGRESLASEDFSFGISQSWPAHFPCGNAQPPRKWTIQFYVVNETMGPISNGFTNTLPMQIIWAGFMENYLLELNSTCFWYVTIKCPSFNHHKMHF